MFRLIARNQGAVNGADGSTNDPLGFNARIMQGLVNPNLVGTQCPTALQYQYHATRDSVVLQGAADFARNFGGVPCFHGVPVKGKKVNGL